ncbi:MAG: glycoside hydrolase family 20 zincin-like fold domain-containing protein [Armatimonadota bacterium]
MLKAFAVYAGVVLVFLGVPSAAFAVSKSMGDGESLNWIRHLVPLPKSVRITGQVVVPRGGIEVVPDRGNDLLTIQAAKELREAAGARSESVRDGFKITMQVGGPESEPLTKLKNSDQAYRILSVGDGEREIRLVALTPNGLYYAAKTLQQLITARATKESIMMPVLEVIDWPDMAKRGLWGGDNYECLKWLGDRKMNIMEQISGIGVDEQARPFARVRPGREPLVIEGPLYGIEFAPVILHLEQVGRLGVFEHFPDFKGKTEHPGAMCYSQPGVADLIAEWMVQLARVPTVTTIDCWLTENLHGQSGCQCEKCRDQKWQLLEIRTVLAAWRKAKEKLGREFTLRITTSEATEPENRAIFAELPPEVQVTYYHSLFTYNNRRMQIIPDHVAQEARKGRWMGVIPNLCSHTNYWEPYTGADFIHYRINEFVNKGLAGLVGYVTPGVHYYRFNTEAAAEWSWNANGRSPREFAASYAVRYGIKDPEKFADWVETIGPVAWDVYGSHWLYGEECEQPGRTAEMLKKGRLPELGSVLWDCYPAPWGNIKDEARLEEDVKAASRALKMARAFGWPLAVEESLVVDGNIRALKALYELRRIVRPSGVAEADRPAARALFREYVAGLKQARDAITRWEKMVTNPAWSHMFTTRVTDLIGRMIREMTDTARELGIEK